MIYNPANWYWSGTPGIYGSARGGLVTAPTTDAAYLAWRAGGSIAPTTWPQDESGAVTVAALDAVLIAAGLPPTGLASTTKAQLQAAAWAKSQNLLSTSRNYTVVGVVGSISCDALSSSANLQGINIWGLANPTGAQAWTDNAYSVFTLTGTEAVAFANAVLAYGQSVYAELATVVTGINSGSITTLAQIASAGWPS